MSAVLRVHVSGFTCPVTIGVMLMLIRLKIIVRPAEKGALGPCNLVKREAWRREIETRENRRAISMGKEPIISLGWRRLTVLIFMSSGGGEVSGERPKMNFFSEFGLLLSRAEQTALHA